MDVEDKADNCMSPEQKEILDGLVKRFSLMVGGVFWLRRLPVWVRRELLWSLLGSFGGVGVGAGFWRLSQWKSPPI
jgi:uncharacterized membrane protein